MTPDQFCYWLQGYFEISKLNGSLNEEQVKIIKNHLCLVFNNVTSNNDSSLEENTKISMDDKDLEGLKRRIENMKGPVGSTSFC